MTAAVVSLLVLINPILLLWIKNKPRFVLDLEKRRFQSLDRKIYCSDLFGASLCCFLLRNLFTSIYLDSKNLFLIIKQNSLLSLLLFQTHHWCGPGDPHFLVPFTAKYSKYVPGFDSFIWGKGAALDNEEWASSYWKIFICLEYN